MQNFEEVGRELQRRGKTDRIKALAESEDGVRLSRMVDAGKIEQAAKSGDGEQLRRMLSSVLGTDEGRRLAESLKRLMEE